MLAEKRDYEILSRIYQLEKLKLNKDDKDLINLIRTQLKRDWRKPLMKKLNQLLKKYKIH